MSEPAIDNQHCPTCGEPASDVRDEARGEPITERSYGCKRGHDWNHPGLQTPSDRIAAVEARIEALERGRDR